MRNRIIENTRQLLDEDYQEIIIRVDKNGFQIIPTKEVECLKTSKEEDKTILKEKKLRDAKGRLKD